MSRQIFQPVENSSGAFLTYPKSHPTRSRLTGEKKLTNDIYEDCNYIDDDSRRQNNRQRILKGQLRPIYVSFFEILLLISLTFPM